MQVFVRGPTGRTITYEVQPTDTILTFKRQLREKERIPLHLMLLISPGKRVMYDGTLLDYKIQKENTIQLLLKMGGGSYCAGCILPALICLSAHVSLQCGEKLSFDNQQLLHSIKTKLVNLDNNAMKAVIECIQTCGKEWTMLENDDAEFFQYHTTQRQSEAVNSFTGAICRMINPYIAKYRTPKMVESTKRSVNYEAAYGSGDAGNSTLTKPIEVDWLTFLHETRCPICLCRFNIVQPATNVPNRMPMTLCSTSDKHIVCYDCCRALHSCPLCNGALSANISPAQSMIKSIGKARKKLEEYCFPLELANEITIKSDQQPIAHGAMGKLFCVKGRYAVKCALIANTIDSEEALFHEIAVSRPLAHLQNLVTVYGGVRLPQHGIGIVMEYVNGPSLAAALADSSTIIRNLSIRERLKIALGIAQGLGELHLAKLVHRDFKPENVLLSQSANGVYTPKIADFGISFQLAIASATFVKESSGTVGYDAPEVVIESKTPSAASDIYALAFTLYELLTAKRVFSGLKSAQILAKFTMRGERPGNWPNDISDYIKQAIEQAWSTKPDQRATIGGIIHAIRKSLDPNQLPCIEMLQKANRSRNKIASVQLEDFGSFELFALNEFVKRISIDDCEAMQMFIDALPRSL